MKQRKKLIEVALPLEAINKESLRRKQKAPKGWPTSFHKWWAQRPLAAARAVLFAQIVDDPSSLPELFPSEQEQQNERKRLLKIIEELALWDNTSNTCLLERAKTEIQNSWQRSCLDNLNHKHRSELFSQDSLPIILDPFTGSGSIPLSAQWMGFETCASDLNPVSVLINKAMIEIPFLFKRKEPVNPVWHQKNKSEKMGKKWEGVQGLAEDVRYYGEWVKKEAEKRVGHLYPKVKITQDIVDERPDLKQHLGKSLSVIAWIWARTVKSPNPAYTNVLVPLVSNFMLSSKAGKEVYAEPVIENGHYRFIIKNGKPKNAERIRRGTKLSRGANFECIMSNTPISGNYIKSEGKAGRMGVRLIATVVEGKRGRIYLSPTAEQEETATSAKPEWKPENELIGKCRDQLPLYGMNYFADIFTPRQLLSLTVLSELIGEAMEKARNDAIKAGVSRNSISLQELSSLDEIKNSCDLVGAKAYSEAVGIYLACIIDRMVYYGSSLTTWLPKDNALRDCMPRHALAMVWDFAEANPFGKSSGDVLTCTNVIANYLDVATPTKPALAVQSDAATTWNGSFVISTDPPYYDNISYADLSDYFYIWLRRSLRSIYPGLFATVAVPKEEELIAASYRHNSAEKAKAYFLSGMTNALRNLSKQSIPGYPLTIYYAFKQSETNQDAGTASTGWEIFLEAVIRADLTISGTWPLRTEGAGRMIASGTNALASSIVLVCRKREQHAPIVTRRDFVSALKSELPKALNYLQEGNIAPVDMAQASIGPGMAIFTRYEKVLDAHGQSMKVREALELINHTLDEVLAEQEGEFDSDTRWAVSWFEQSGFNQGEFGVAEVLARAKNTSVAGMVQAGILSSSKGKVKLLKPEELPKSWDPEKESRLTTWEMVHHLIRINQQQGESPAAALIEKLGSKADLARDLAYRLYSICERKKRTSEAIWYNGLVQSWTEMTRLAQDMQTQSRTGTQSSLFEEDN